MTDDKFFKSGENVFKTILNAYGIEMPPRKDRVKQLGQVVAAIILICLAVISIAVTIGVWQWLVN